MTSPPGDSVVPSALRITEATDGLIGNEDAFDHRFRPLGSPSHSGGGLAVISLGTSASLGSK